MKIRLVGLAVVLLAMVAGQAHAQLSPIGTTVQLPSFHFFTVATTVSVPDRGTAYLGGVNRSSSGSTGLSTPLFGRVPGLGRGFGNRAIGRSTGASGMSVSAFVIDHNEWDRAVLAEAARRRGAKFDVLGRPVDGGSQEMLVGRGRSSLIPRANETSTSVSRIHKPRVDTSASDAQQAIAYMKKGRQAEAEGKPHVAKIYYRMVAKRGSVDLKQAAADRLAAIDTASRPARVATRD